MFWTNEHQQMIEKYYWCYTASTSAITRNYLYTKLYPVFSEIIERAIVTSKLHFKKDLEEVRQVAHVHIFTKILPKLKPELLQGAQQFIYVGVRNIIITYFYVSPSKSNKIQYDKTYDVTHSDYLVDSNYADDNMIAEDTRRLIIAELDRKIKFKRVINSTYGVYLQLLKEYIIDNDFDERGAKEYIMERMNIKSNTFNTISSLLDIKVTNFSKKYLPEDDD